jgi:hypothetical protein
MLISHLASPNSDPLLCEILSCFTNIAFRDEAVAKSWVAVWVQLLDCQLKSADDANVSAWLGEHRFENFHGTKDAKELSEIKLCYSGILESSIDDREWNQVGNPSKGFKLVLSDGGINFPGCAIHLSELRSLH